MKKVVSMFLTICMLLGLTNTAFATDMQNQQLNQPRVTVTEVSPMEFSSKSFISTFATEAPSSRNKWDLSAEHYYGTFSFEKFIYTNNRFVNHGGKIYLYVDSAVTAMSGNNQDLSKYTIKVHLTRRSFWGTNIYVKSVEVATGKSWLISFTNCDPNEDYYITFEQGTYNISCRIQGNFKIRCDKQW